MTVQTGFAFPARDWTGIVTAEGAGGESQDWRQPGVFIPAVGSFAAFTTKFTSLSPAPGTLAPTPAVARWTPIAFAFACPPGYTVCIVARIGSDSALWMVPYDESLGGMAPLFEERSTVIIAGDRFVGRTLNFSILPNGGWQRPGITLTPYLALEVTQ